MDRKIQERAILDHFREKYPDFPKGKVFPSESPDFIIKTSRKKSVGVELVSLPSLSYNIKNTSALQHLISDIQSIISKKEKKILLYQKKLANEYWLIITTDSIKAGNFNIPHHLERIETEAGFNNIFLFELFNGKIYPF